MNKKGFVLMETITVVTVLCFVLAMLFASFNVIISKLQKNNTYDNTEYIYKTYMIREELVSSNVSVNERINIIKPQDDYLNDYQKKLFEWLNVVEVYIILWDPAGYKSGELNGLKPTTQQYIRSLDPYEDADYRIVVMYEDVNSDKDSAYQYASLKWLG